MEVDVQFRPSYSLAVVKLMPDQQVLDYIASRSGKDFDPDVVKTFFKWYDLRNIIKREK